MYLAVIFIVLLCLIGVLSLLLSCPPSLPHRGTQQSIPHPTFVSCVTIIFRELAAAAPAEAVPPAGQPATVVPAVVVAKAAEAPNGKDEQDPAPEETPTAKTSAKPKPTRKSTR